MSEARIPPDARQIGRPTKFNDETVERALCCNRRGDAAQRRVHCCRNWGNNLEGMARAVPDLEEGIADARGHGRLRALPAIKAAGEKHWRAWNAWLKLTHPAEYRGSA